MQRKTINTIVFLVGAYVICQAIADIGATKMVQVFGFVIPGGTFVFAFTFTLRDVLHKRLGKRWATAAIWTAGLLNIFQALYLWAIGQLSAPVWFALNEPWGAIFAIVPAITIGSITAELLSENIDTEIYHLIKTRVPRIPQWARVLLSNAVSLPIDSLTFALLAFVILPPLFGGETMPVWAALQLTIGQIVFKAIVTLLSLPTIYLVKDQSILSAQKPMI